MTVSADQLQAFVDKYYVEPPRAQTPVTLSGESGSYTHEKLGELLENWSEANELFYFTEKIPPQGGMPKYWIICPGETENGWPQDGTGHSDRDMTLLTSSSVVWVENGHPRFRCGHSHCDQGAVGGKKTWKHLVEAYDPGGRMQHALLTGTPHLGQEVSPKPPESGGFVTEKIEFPMESHNETPPLEYPLEVWDGTDYAEFAAICSEGNYIPREFLIEALKTVTGAVVGSGLSIPDIEGGLARFYTVLMGGAGSGKGTSISWATGIFKDISLGGTALASLLWSPATKIEQVPWVHIGACEEGFNSAPGMQRSNQKGQARWMQTFEELDHMIEGSGIDGSGKALMGVNRQLYDREEFVTTTTGKRDAIAGRAQNSILAATTPELWTDMFAGKQVRGSGLFQRFNLMASEEKRKKGTLRKPKLDVFKGRFASRILDLEERPIEMAVTDGAMEEVDRWFTQAKFEEADGEVRGRLNILAWRNALHLAWQRGLTQIGLEEIAGALRLSDYQFEVRRRYTPAEGENPWALVENKIRNFLKIEGSASRRDIVRRLSLHRYGGGMTDKALANLQSSGEVTLSTEETSRGQKSIRVTWVN